MESTCTVGLHTCLCFVYVWHNVSFVWEVLKGKIYKIKPGPNGDHGWMSAISTRELEFVIE